MNNQKMEFKLHSMQSVLDLTKSLILEGYCVEIKRVMKRFPDYFTVIIKESQGDNNG